MIQIMYNKSRNNQRSYSNKNMNKDNHLEKKKQLQITFIKNVQKLESTTDESYTTDKKSEVDNEKNNELENKILKLNKEIKSKDLKISKLREEVKEVKSSSLKLKQKYNKTYLFISEYELKLAEKDDLIKDKNIEIENLKNQLLVKSNRQQELENLVGIGYKHELELENEKLKLERENIMKRIKKLHDIYTNKYSVVYDKEEEFKLKLRQVMTNSKKRVALFREENLKLINNVNELNKKNNELIEKNKSMLHNEKKESSTNANNFKRRLEKYIHHLYMTITKKKYIKTKTLNGFLMLDATSKKLAFKDTFNNVYKIRYFKKSWMKTAIGSYAIAHLDEYGEAIIVYVGTNKEYEAYIEKVEIPKTSKKGKKRHL